MFFAFNWLSVSFHSMFFWPSVPTYAYCTPITVEGPKTTTKACAPPPAQERAPPKKWFMVAAGGAGPLMLLHSYTALCRQLPCQDSKSMLDKMSQFGPKGQNLSDPYHSVLHEFSQLWMVWDRNWKYVYNFLEITFLNMFVKILYIVYSPNGKRPALRPCIL
jgi:hypothetical protein